VDNGFKAPITLDVLQGSWVGSSGSSITVFGTELSINGMPLNNHIVQLDEDGKVVSIGKLWQLDKWTDDGGIQWRCSSTQDNMESARADVWHRADDEGDAWATKMKELGYAASSADPLARGVEGCMPGTMGIEEGEGPAGYAASRDRRDVKLLRALISQWREPTTDKAKCREVMPDCTNRAQTGLGVELVHFVAICITQQGFKKRVGTEGHDIPVLVREPAGAEIGAEAYKLWSARVAEEEGFPPVRADPSQEFFTSLGNGHFFQALNLIACECKGINDDRVYSIGKDKAENESG
jgi:hypothetical protein